MIIRPGIDFLIQAYKQNSLLELSAAEIIADFKMGADND